MIRFDSDEEIVSGQWLNRVGPLRMHSRVMGCVESDMEP